VKSGALMHDMGAAEYRQLYTPERTSLNKGYAFYRVAFAQTKTCLVN
jgi:hypothetical protein